MKTDAAAGQQQERNDGQVVVDMPEKVVHSVPVYDAGQNVVAVSSSQQKETTRKRYAIAFILVCLIVIAIVIIIVVTTRGKTVEEDPAEVVDFSTGVSLITNYDVSATIRSRLAKTKLSMTIANALDCVSIHAISLQLPLNTRYDIYVC